MHIDRQAGKVIADQVMAAHAAVQNAIAEISRLGACMAEAEHSSNVAPAHSQKAYEALADTLLRQVSTRASLVSAQRQMAALKAKSNLETVGFGCAGQSDILDMNAKRPIRLVSDNEAA
jgi:hypothetical protein